MPALIPAILKGILFLILLLLGLLLLILLLLLFVPFCYRGHGKRVEEQLSGALRVSWLFSLLRLKLSYREQMKGELYFLCFRIYQLEHEEEEEAVHIANGDAEKASAYAEKPESKAPPASENEVYPAPRQSVTEKGTEALPEQINGTEAETAAALEAAEERQRNRQLQEKKRRHAKAESSSEAERKQEKLAAIWNRLQQLYRRAETEYDFFQSERTQRFLHYLKSKLFRFLRELIPRRIAGELRFGFADPAVTGQGAALAALLLPFYRDSLRIEPLFDREELSGELSFRGHLQLFVFLFGAAQIWFHRDFRYVYRHIRGKDKRQKTEGVHG